MTDITGMQCGGYFVSICVIDFLLSSSVILIFSQMWRGRSLLIIINLNIIHLTQPADSQLTAQSYLQNPPVENALVEDGGARRAPDSPDQLVGGGQHSLLLPGDQRLVRAPSHHQGVRAGAENVPGHAGVVGVVLLLEGGQGQAVGVQAGLYWGLEQGRRDQLWVFVYLHLSVIKINY